jgi:hypothetical protein
MVKGGKSGPGKPGNCLKQSTYKCHFCD